jgi:hypothetical protein
MIVLFWDVFDREHPVIPAESAQWEGWIGTRGQIQGGSNMTGTICV